MKKGYTLFFIFACIFSSYWGWTRFAQEEMDIAETQRTHLFSETNWRNPAAIRKSYDFSKLSGPAFEIAGQKRLLRDMKVTLQGEKVGIELGHFVVKGEDGNKTFACEFYDRVQFEFIGEGVAESGELPQMVLEGPCEISKNINRMEPVWLPIEKMRKLSPANLKGHFFADEKVSISLNHVSYAWPPSWRLRGLKIFNQVNTQRVLEVNAQKIDEYVSDPFILSW